MASQPKQAQQVFEFGDFCLDRAERRLLRDGRPVALTPKAFDVLLLLVESSGHVVAKEELLSRVWPDSFVEEGNLKVTISMLRKALGERGYIETVAKRGYRFVASVTELTGEQIEVVVREQFRSSVTIEESDEPAPRKTLPASVARQRRRLFWMIGGPAILAIAVAGYLWWKPRPAPAAPSKTIAVLPFKPLAADHRDESLELGMADTLIARLSGIKQLSVRPLSAVRKYSSLEQDALAAGREQRVEAVLDGSLQRVGDRIRVTVRLVSTADGQPVWVATLGQVLYHARHYDQALDQMRKALEMDPNFLNTHVHAGLIYLQKQMYREALGEFQKALELSASATNVVALAGATQALSGNRAEADKALSNLQALLKEGRAQARDLAIIYIGLGDKDNAYEALGQALEDRSWLIPLLKVDPYFDRLRSDARFAGLLVRAGLQ